MHIADWETGRPTPAGSKYMFLGFVIFLCAGGPVLSYCPSLWALGILIAELSGGSENVTAVVVGRREQAQLTGLVREALQNAGQLGRDGVEIEARQPVWLDSKTRRMPGSYRSGMVLEDRTDAKERKSYVIDRVHEDTRVLSLIDGDGVLTRMKIGDISADWRLFSRETLSVATGEKLLAVAGDREHSLKAKDRLEVTGISEKGIRHLPPVAPSTFLPRV